MIDSEFVSLNLSDILMEDIELLLGWKWAVRRRRFHLTFSGARLR